MGIVKDLPPDKKHERPKNRAEKLKQIRGVFQFNDWGNADQKYFLNSLNFSKFVASEFTDEELDRILKHFEEGRMILYSN